MERSEAMSTTTAENSTTTGRAALPEVLTSAEAAQYLRVSEVDIVELAAAGELPGRKIKDQWRFRRDTLREWLCSQSVKDRLLRHAGAAKDDPYLERMLKKIYRDRGRPMLEGEE